jgi:hypothetical protein
VWSTYYWTKEVRSLRTNGTKIEAEHKPCKTMDVKVILLFLFMFWATKFRG